MKSAVAALLPVGALSESVLMGGWGGCLGVPRSFSPLRLRRACGVRDDGTTSRRAAGGAE